MTEPSLPEEMAREESKTLRSQTITHQSAKKQHSTNRQTVQAAGWVGLDTDDYINQRVREGKKFDKKFSRSRAVREMLEACAQTEMFERNQRVFVPVIQDTMRSMHRKFENRFLAIIARIAYQVGEILFLLTKYIAIRTDERTAHKFEVDSERDARVGVTENTPQIEEVKTRIRQSMEGDS